MRVLLTILLFVMLVNANDISYNFHLTNNTPYKNQAIFLDLNISQENHSQVMRFKFNLKPSKNYEFYQIAFKEKDAYHHLQHHYTYLIYPKKEGKIDLNFKLIKSLTDDDKVAYAISGDRDNVKGLVKKDIEVKLPPLILNVKPLSLDVDLVGEYKMSYSLDKTSTSPYDPIYLKIILEGKGLISPFDWYDKNSTEYHLFTQKPKVKTLHHIKGTTTHMEWDYAISSKESFILPKVVLKGFNPKLKKSYELTIPQQAIEIEEVSVENLIDKEDYPSSLSSFDWSWLGWIFSYIMVFLAGFLMPRDLFRRDKRNEEESFEEKIASFKTDRELLKFLLSLNDTKYSESIKSLEEVIYFGKKISLSTIKKSLRELQ